MKTGSQHVCQGSGHSRQDNAKMRLWHFQETWNSHLSLRLAPIAIPQVPQLLLPGSGT